MKKLLIFILIWSHLSMTGQVYNNVPILLKNGKIACEGYLDRIDLDSTVSGFKVTTVLKAKYPVARGNTIRMGGVEPEELFVFATYDYDHEFRLVDTKFQFINYGVKGTFSKEFQIMQKTDKIGGEVLAEPKDLISMEKIGISITNLELAIFPPKSDIKWGVEKLKFEQKEDNVLLYPNKLTINYIDENLFGKVKGFNSEEYKLLNASERDKIKKSKSYKGRISEYEKVDRKINFDHILDDPKNDKMRCLYSYGHEESGNVITGFGHPEKLQMKKFSFWGFDKEGKVINSFYKEFDFAQDWPYSTVINDSPPVIYYRPKLVYSYFLPPKADKPLYVFIQDGNGKVISEKNYLTNLPANEILYKTVNEDGSQSLVTLSKKEKENRLNTFYIDKNDQLITSSYSLDSIDKRDNFNSRKYSNESKTKLENDGQVLIYNQYINKNITDPVTKKMDKKDCYDGLLFLTLDRDNKINDFFHIGRGFTSNNINPFKTDFYEGQDGSLVLVVYRDADIMIKNKSVFVNEFIVVQIDKNGKITEKNNIKQLISSTEEIFQKTKIPGVFYVAPNLNNEHSSFLFLKSK